MGSRRFFDKFTLNEKEEMFVDMDGYMNVCGYGCMNVCGQSKLWMNNFNVQISYTGSTQKNHVLHNLRFLKFVNR